MRAVKPLAAHTLRACRPAAGCWLLSMMLRIATGRVALGAIGNWYSAGSVIASVVSVAVIALPWDSRAKATSARSDEVPHH